MTVPDTVLTQFILTLSASHGIITFNISPGDVLNRAVRIILIIIGTLSVGLAILGVILPLLPTTPFLLLAAACYARSSERFHDWLLNHRVFGEYIRNYRDHRAIKFQAKVLGIGLLWLTIGISILVMDPVWVKIMLAAIAVGVTTHLLSLRTIRS